MNNDKLADLLRDCLSDYSHPNFTDRYGMADRIRAALAAHAAEAAQARACTCHPDDNPPTPCPQKFAYSECVKAAQAQASNDYTGLAKALRAQRQIDEDGTEVGVSRQACDEAADVIESLAAAPQPPAEDVRRVQVWRQAFIDERARRYIADGMKIEQARIHAETDAAHADAALAKESGR